MIGDYHKVIFVQGLGEGASVPKLCETLSVDVETLSVPQAIDCMSSLGAGVLMMVEQSAGFDASGNLVDWVQQGLPQQAFALYGVEKHSVEPVLMLTQGIKGLLYQSDRIDLSLSALQALLSGELWYSRAILEQAVEQLVVFHAQTNKRQRQDVLTTREQAVARLVALGNRNKEIARKLFISEYTVKAHLASIFRKTETRNRTELVNKLGLN